MVGAVLKNSASPIWARSMPRHRRDGAPLRRPAVMGRNWFHVGHHQGARATLAEADQVGLSRPVGVRSQTGSLPASSKRSPPSLQQVVRPDPGEALRARPHGCGDHVPRGHGTGLDYRRRRCQASTSTLGIAASTAVTDAAGMPPRPQPVVAIYSTFPCNGPSDRS